MWKSQHWNIELLKSPFLPNALSCCNVIGWWANSAYKHLNIWPNKVDGYCMSSKYDLQNDLSLINVFKCNSDMQPRSAVALFLDQFWKSPGW